MGMRAFDLSAATSAQRAAAERLLRRSLASASRFGTLADARAAGYVGDPGRRYVKDWRLGHQRLADGPIRDVHMNHPGHLSDGHLLDPRRPETLVYRRQAAGRYELVALMYRAPAGPVPTPAPSLVRWHLHGGCVPANERHDAGVTVPHEGCPAGELLHHGSNAMLHVWLDRSLRTAFGMDALPRLPKG